MKKNMGNADRALRILIAGVIACLYFTDRISGTPAIILLVLAGVMLFTGIVGICLLYLPFGLRTYKKPE